MRKKSFCLLLAPLVTTLVSCVTAPVRPSLTVELFDWRPAGSMSAIGTLSGALPFPKAPDPLGASADLRPGSEVSILLAASAEAAPVPQEAVPLRLPTAPAIVLANSPDIGLVLSTKVRPVARFPLLIPEAPAARKPVPPSAATGKQAAAPSVRQSAAPTPGSAFAPSTAAAGTVPAASPAPLAAAKAGAGVPAASAPAPSSAADSYGRLREIYARQGDELKVGLDGPAFLFLGLPDAQADGMSFKSKENKAGKTSFTFQALKLGTYDLDFLQQDNSTGKSAKETVRVHVITDQDFASAMAQQAAPGQSAGVETGDPAFATRLAGLGAYTDAVAELLKGYKEGNPGLNDQIAALYLRTGALDAAAKYYAKNLSPSNPYTQNAVLGMVRIAVEQKDQQGLMALLKKFLAITDPGIEETLIRAARMEKDKGEIGVGLDLAAEYASRFPGGKWRDEAEFLAAELLTADSSFRDISRARDLYRDILAAFPESAFADPARQRLLYIERHFYQVR